MNEIMSTHEEDNRLRKSRLNGENRSKYRVSAPNYRFDGIVNLLMIWVTFEKRAVPENITLTVIHL